MLMPLLYQDLIIQSQLILKPSISQQKIEGKVIPFFSTFSNILKHATQKSDLQKSSEWVTGATTDDLSAMISWDVAMSVVAIWWHFKLKLFRLFFVLTFQV